MQRTRDSTPSGDSGRASRPQDITMEAVAESADSCRDFSLVQPQIDFKLYDLFYLAVQYLPMRGRPHLLYQKYLKVLKADAAKDPAPAQPVALPVDKLVAQIDMKIYRGSNRELVGSLNRCLELPNALPQLRLPGLSRSVETAGASGVFSLSNIMNERLAQEANNAAAGIPGFHSIFFGLHRVHPWGQFELMSRRVQPISNSQVTDFFDRGVITTDHATEIWSEPNRLLLTFDAPPIAKRRSSLRSCAASQASSVAKDS